MGNRVNRAQTRDLMLRRRLNIVALTLFTIAGGGSAKGADLIGYLPYYRMSSSYVANTLPGQLEMLDEVRYFGLTVDGDGEIVPLSGALESHKANISVIQSSIASLPGVHRPRLTVTLGAAGQDTTFTQVAASQEKRGVFAENIGALLAETQAVGVDIDWEHPDAGIQRTSHYPAMLQRIKQEVGSERRVYATVAPSVVIPSTVFGGPNGIDGVSLMTYDLGWWSNDPSNPNNGEHSLQEYVSDTVEAWTDPAGSPNLRPWVFGTWGNGASADRVGVALPFYGRSLTTQNAFTYADLLASNSSTDGEYYQFSGQQVWAASPELAAERVQYAIEQGLDHIIIWELGQDTSPASESALLKAAFDARQDLVGSLSDLNNDGLVNAADYTIFRDRSVGGLPSTEYDAWAEDYTISSSAAAAAISAVPEPCSLTIAMVIGFAACCTRRSRIAGALVGESRQRYLRLDAPPGMHERNTCRKVAAASEGPFD